VAAEMNRDPNKKPLLLWYGAAIAQFESQKITYRLYLQTTISAIVSANLKSLYPPNSPEAATNLQFS